MGLDVYLYHVDDPAARTKLLAEDKGAGYPGETRIEQPSAKYPEHSFKIGYFRSSYNDSGINHQMGILGLPTLYDVFSVTGDMYDVWPDWSDARERCCKAVEGLRAHMEGAAGRYRVMNVHHNMFANTETLPSSEREAMDAFKKQLPQASPFKAFSNSDGWFFRNGLTVSGVVPGVMEFCGRRLLCTYIVFASEDNWSWYLQAWEIVLETIDFALAHPERDHLLMCWSG